MSDATTTPKEVNTPIGFGALMGVKTLAAYLDLSPRTIWSLSAAGKLPQPIKVPGLRRKVWKRQDVDEAITRWNERAAAYRRYVKE